MDFTSGICCFLRNLTHFTAISLKVWNLLWHDIKIRLHNHLHLLHVPQFVTLSAGLLPCLSNHLKAVFHLLIASMRRLSFLCYQYLHKLFKRDHHKGQRYHERQISLYAEYDRSNLLPFLRDSTHCPLEKVQPLTWAAPLSSLFTFINLILLSESELYIYSLLFSSRPWRSASRDTLWRKLSFCSVSPSFSKTDTLNVIQQIWALFLREKRASSFGLWIILLLHLINQSYLKSSMMRN